MRRIFAVTLIAVLALSAGAASASSGSLTATEYQHLLTFEQSVAGHSMKTLGELESARVSCRELAPVSALMRAERADCNGGFDFFVASAQALLRVKACAPQTTVNGRFSCLMPAYVRLNRVVHAFYNVERRVHRAAASRGLTGACMRLLGTAPGVLNSEAQMTRDASRLVSAMRHRVLLSAQRWGSLYDAATAEMESLSPKTSVQVCPHA